MADLTWAVVELMGHVRLAGRLSEEEKFGGKMGRLDIPTGGPVCSGVSANWCPIHGDCKCKDPMDLNDDSCPLHGAGDHGDAQDERYTTQFFTAGSVYRITVVTEEVARQIAKTSSDIAPVKSWEMPKALLAKTGDIPFDTGGESWN